MTTTPLDRLQAIRESPTTSESELKWLCNTVEEFYRQSGIAADIQSERSTQDREHGGPEHDDKHTPAEWISVISRHTGKAVTSNPERYRLQMVRVAALATAAIASHDRKMGGSN